MSAAVRESFRGWLVLGICASAVGSGSAIAQSSERAVERIEPGLFHLDKVDAYLEIEAQLEQFRVRSKDGSGRVNARQVNRSSLVQELIGLSFSGDVVHPYFIDFSGSLAVGYTESRFREQTLTFTDSDRASGFLSEFDVRADLFKTKPISGTVFGRRLDDRVGRLFLPSLREVRWSYGTSWSYRHPVFPMELSFEHVDTQRSGNRDKIDDERIIEDRLRLGGDWRISDHQTLSYSYEHGRDRFSYQGSDFSFDTRRDQFVLDYDLEFGRDHQHRFSALLRYQDERGDLARDLFEFRPELEWQHTPDLSTRYSYDFRREELGGLQVDLHRVDFQVRHQFLKNLTTVFDAFGLTERTDDDVETTQGGASIDWQYTRSNPYGQLTAELGLAGDSERTRGDNGLRLVSNESGTFRDPLPLYLTRPNAVPVSVIVTDRTGRIVYAAGTDYTMIQAGDRLALYRVASGRITNGQVVLIDYRHRTPSKGRIDTVRVDFGIRQAFSWGLTPYYRFNYRHQEVDVSRGFAFIADRTDHHRLGFTFTRPMWSLSGEYEIFDDAIEPYDAFHLGGTVVPVRTDRQAIDIRLDFSQYFFDGGFDDRDVSEFNLSARHEYRFNDRWSNTLVSTWRWEDDSVRGTTNGLDIESVLAYRRGNLSIEFSLEYDLLRIAGSREDSVGAWLALRWDFENVVRVN